MTWGASVEFSLGEDTLTLGIDSADTLHDAVITNPNMSMFRVQNFADAERNIDGFFTEWKGSRGDWELEAGVRYNQVQIKSDEVSLIGLMQILLFNTSDLAHEKRREYLCVPRNRNNTN